MIRQDYSVYQRTDYLIPANIDIDISGAELIFVVEKEGGDNLFRKDIGDGITIVDENAGDIEINIEPEDVDVRPLTYEHELLIIDADSNRYVAMKGNFEVKESLTKDES